MKKTSAREIAALLLLVLGGCPQQREGGPRPLPELTSALGRTTQPRATLELAETIKCRELRARLLRAGATPHALPELDQTALPALAADEAILSLRVEAGRLRRLLARGASVRELPSRELRTLDPLLARTRDELELGEDLRGGPLASLLRASGEALLEGVEPASLRRLLVIPDGLARAIPLASVPVEGEPLIARLELAYLPCLGLLRPGPRPSAAEALAPAYPARPLEGAGEEVAAVRAAFGGGAQVLLGPAASPERLERALASTGAVHFAGHGLADLPGQAPELIFAGQRKVTVQSATRRPVGAALVVLGSCATAEVARFRDGQRLRPPVTMPEALLAAGARRVVAASWTVKDRQSALQMATFYRELRAVGPAAALARAQRAARQGFEPPHPRFWAFYAVYGGW